MKKTFSKSDVKASPKRGKTFAKKAPETQPEPEVKKPFAKKEKQ